MTAFHTIVTVDTAGHDHIVDITDELRHAAHHSGVYIGQLTAMVVGSTASLTTLEYEPGLVKVDIAAAFERVAPRDGVYQHELTWHDDNGHSHVRASLVGPSLSLPIVNADLPLGTWQQIVLIDSDTRPRRRRIEVVAVGTPSED